MTAEGGLQMLRSRDGWTAELLHRLRLLPARLRDRQFWLIQGIVLTVVATHFLIESRPGTLFASLHHVPVVLFVVPVIFASLSFGWEGGVLTGTWSALLSVPNLFVYHRTDLEWVGEVLETVMIVVVGVALGWRVEREQRLRQRLQGYASGLLRAQEDERLRLARDIHDDTVQSFAILCRGLDDIVQSAPDHSALATARELREHANMAADAARRLCTDLRPAILDDLGLAAGIRWLLQDLEHRTSIKVSLEISGEERRLDRETELVVFRITQEAVHNVERHARASNLRLKLRFGRDRITMEAVDDGVGFVPVPLDEGSPNERLGLTGMQERARLVNGEVSVKSELGHGTTVSLFVPVR